MSRPISIAIPFAISITGIGLVALLGMSLHNGTIPLWKISDNKLLNLTYTMQLMALPISFAALAFMFFYNQENFKIFLRLKASSASEEASNWKFMGPVIAIAFTLGTTMYMSAGVVARNGIMNEKFYKLLPLVILFAATNAWTEEILARFVIVSGLHGKLSATAICWISATIFGLGHFYGTPNGIFGVIASGTLGWFLAKSVVETKSMGWALFIHFLQDVVIFGAGAMILAAG